VAPLRALGAARLVAVCSIAATYWLELQAMASGYGLRVTSDTPTYIAVLRDLALHPFHPQSPLLAAPNAQTSHASPDLQALGFVWRWIAPNRSLVDPVAAYHLLAAWGLVVTALLLHATFTWTRGLVGRYAAWISIPVLLTLFGPANVIWAGDFSFHGLLYDSYYSQTLGAALLLYALHLTPRARTWRQHAACTGLVATLLLVHPFTGVVFLGLTTLRAAGTAWRDRAWDVRTSIVLAGGFGLGCLWPAYSLSAAMTVFGLGGWELVGISLVVPWAIAHRPARLPLASPIARSGRGVARRGRATAAVLSDSKPILTALAIAGLAIVIAVAAREWWLLSHPLRLPSGTVYYRSAIYWDTDLLRWPLLFAAGSVGAVGLLRLAGRGASLPGVWFAAFFTAGLLGALGMAVPLWYRLLLFCQFPLALGTAIVLAELRPSVTRLTVTAGLAASAVLRLAFLLLTAQAVTLWGASWQPEGYSLGKYIPADRPGLVAADPYAGYYIPAATGHKTLIVSPGHVGSPAEQRVADRGYLLLHQLYSSPRWRAAIRRMWRMDVRYVVVDHNVSLDAPTLEQFVAQPSAQWTTWWQREHLGWYFAHLNLLGHVVANTPQYVIYRLDRAKVERIAGGIG
jgi:hypothetical protein